MKKRHSNLLTDVSRFAEIIRQRRHIRLFILHYAFFIMNYEFTLAPRLHKLKPTGTYYIHRTDGELLQRKDGQNREHQARGYLLRGSQPGGGQ